MPCRESGWNHSFQMNDFVLFCILCPDRVAKYTVYSQHLLFLNSQSREHCSENTITIQLIVIFPIFCDKTFSVSYVKASEC